MKNMKKFLAMMLALVMVLGMTVTASAEVRTEPAENTADDRGTISIKGVDAAVSANGIKLYPILTAGYDETSGNFTGYEAVAAAEATLNKYQKNYADKQNEGLAADAENRTPETYVDALKAGKAVQIDVNIINELAGLTLSEAAGYSVSRSEGTEDVTIGDKTVTTAAYTCTNVPVGMYLVSIPGTETIIYNHAIASIYYTQDSEMANELLIMNSEIAAKATLAPGIEKDVKVAAGDKGMGQSANVGDIITYQVTVDPVPNYSGSNPVLNVVDKLSSNLELQNGITVKVVDGNEETPLVENTHFTKTTTTENEKTVLTVNFVVNDQYKLAEYAGKKVVIEYGAELKAAAEGNEKDNDNEATLNYTRDSKLSGDDGKPETPPTDKTHTYTFNIGGSVTGLGEKDILQKVGEGTDENGLPGAKFTIYTEDPTGKENPSVYNTNPNHVNGIVESKEGGKIVIKGLKAGIGVGKGITYYLKETEAPGNYTLNSHVFEIYVEATCKDDGTLDTWTIKIDGENTNTFKVENNAVRQTATSDPVQIQNTTMSVLPSTGGIGTTIFTIAGCAIMVLAAALFFVSRRKSSVK